MPSATGSALEGQYSLSGMGEIIQEFPSAGPFVLQNMTQFSAAAQQTLQSQFAASGKDFAYEHEIQPHQQHNTNNVVEADPGLIHGCGRELRSPIPTAVSPFQLHPAGMFGGKHLPIGVSAQVVNKPQASVQISTQNPFAVANHTGPRPSLWRKYSLDARAKQESDAARNRQMHSAPPMFAGTMTSGFHFPSKSKIQFYLPRIKVNIFTILESISTVSATSAADFLFLYC